MTQSRVHADNVFNKKIEKSKVAQSTAKDLKVEVYAVDNFPISLQTLKPLFHILGFASKNISKVNDFLFNQAHIP